MSIKFDLKLLQSLSSLGLTEKEAQVYIILLQGGEMTGIKVSKLTELHRQFVYTALASLKEKGLVLQLGTAPAKWTAQSPRKLIALAEDQEKRAKATAETLLALRQVKAGQEFEITEGKQAFRSRVVSTIRSIPSKSEILLICGEWQRYFEHAGEHTHAEYERLRIVKEIRLRIVGPSSFMSAMDKESASRALTEYRVLSGLETNLVNTVIYNDTVDFEIYGEPHLTFSIKNPEVAKSQRNFFDFLWQLGS